MAVKEKEKKKTIENVATVPARELKPGESRYFRVVLSDVPGKTYRNPDLLCYWMAGKLNEYPEPQRKGTPKGEPIGFGEKKYIVILLSLTNTKLKRIAKIAGVSYGVLRKWRTEGIFQHQVRVHNREFANYFCDYIIRVQTAPNVKLSDIPRMVEEKDHAMRSNHLFSEDLKDEITWIAHCKFENKDKNSKLWWKKWGLPKPTKFEKVSYFASTVGAIDPGFKRKIYETQKPTFKKVLINLIKQHIKPERGKFKVGVKDALAALEMLEGVLGIPKE